MANRVHIMCFVLIACSYYNKVTAKQIKIDKQLNIINRSKKENDKQNCLLFSFLFVLESILHTKLYYNKCTVISPVAHKPHYIHMNNQEKLMTRSSILKVHSANSQLISPYPVRFSTDVILFINFFVFLF